MSDDLSRAAYEGRHKTVQELLASRADVAAADHLGQTALHWAARQGHEAVVQVLLEASAPVGVCSKDGATPLHLAAESQASAAVRLLLASRADAAAKARTGRTPLHLAVEKGNADSVAAMLEASSERGTSDSLLTLLDSRGEAPLMSAATRGHGPVVELLVNARADPACQNRWGCTALQKAVAGGHGSSVAALLHGGADASEPARDGATPLQTAAEHNSVEVLKALVCHGVDLSARFSGGRTALHIAAERGFADAAALLVQGRADVNARSDEAQTPLAFAAEHGHAATVRQLLEGGANPWAADETGQMPLHVAVAHGQVEVADMLVQSSAPIDAPDAAGRTPALLAVATHQDTALRLLLRNGAALPEQVTKKDPALASLVAEESCQVPQKRMCEKASASRPRMQASGRPPVFKPEDTVKAAASEPRSPACQLSAPSPANEACSVSVSPQADALGISSPSCQHQGLAKEASVPVSPQAEPVCTRSPGCRLNAPTASEACSVPTSPQAESPGTKSADVQLTAQHLANQACSVPASPQAESLSNRSPGHELCARNPANAVCSEPSSPQAESVGNRSPGDELTDQPTNGASSPTSPQAESLGVGSPGHQLHDGNAAHEVSSQPMSPHAESLGTGDEGCSPACSSSPTPARCASSASGGREADEAGGHGDGPGSKTQPLAASGMMLAEARAGVLAEAAEDLSDQARQLNEMRDLISSLKAVPSPTGALVGRGFNSEAIRARGKARKAALEIQTDSPTKAALEVQAPSPKAEGSPSSSVDVSAVGSSPAAVAPAEFGYRASVLEAAVREAFSEATPQGATSRSSRNTPSKANSSRPTPKHTFFEVMRRKGDGCMVVAWRRYFDVDGDGDLDFQEFCNALTALGYRGDVIELWQALDPQASSRLSLDLFDPEAAKLIAEMGRWCTETLGGPTEVFKELDTSGTGVLTRQGLVAGLRRLGLFTEAGRSEPGCNLASEALRSEEGFLRHMYPIIDIWGHDLVSEEDFLFLELDKEKFRRLKRQFEIRAERGKLPSAGGKRGSAASHLLSNLAKHSTPLGGKNWKQAGRAIDKHLGPAPTDLAPLPARRRERRGHRPPRMTSSDSAPGLGAGVDLSSLPEESEAASSRSGSARAKELLPSVSLPKLPGAAPSVAGSTASVTSSVLSRQRHRVRKLYSDKQASQLPAVVEREQQAAAHMARDAERRMRRQVDSVGQRALEVLGPSKSEDFFNPATALGLFQHYYNVE